MGILEERGEVVGLASFEGVATKLDSLMGGVTDLVVVGGEVVEASLGMRGRCTKNGALGLMSDWRVENQSWSW